jgi:hypothetical protein
MVRLEIEGAIVQRGNTLTMDTQRMDMPTVEAALAEVERQMGRQIEPHDAVIVFGDSVWAVVA